MGRIKQQMIAIEEYLQNQSDYLYDPSQGLPTWKAPISEGKAKALRNSKQHQEWYEDMPDLMGMALQQAEREFLAMQDLDRIQEATDMPLWIQLELDLWEGKHGINEQTYWDMDGRGQRG
jgi:hypothetical protein